MLSFRCRSQQAKIEGLWRRFPDALRVRAACVRGFATQSVANFQGAQPFAILKYALILLRKMVRIITANKVRNTTIFFMDKMHDSLYKYS
jgi:hypothetical protein